MSKMSSARCAYDVMRSTEVSYTYVSNSAFIPMGVFTLYSYMHVYIAFTVCARHSL